LPDDVRCIGITFDEYSRLFEIFVESDNWARTPEGEVFETIAPTFETLRTSQGSIEVKDEAPRDE